MSGTIVNNITRTSGTIAPAAGGLNWDSDVVTGSTASVDSGRGYWINTTSNACTVTLPSSAALGDKISLVDYARTWATNNLIIDSNGNNFQGDPDTYTVDYSTAGQSITIVYSDATKGWIPISDDAVTEAPSPPVTQKGIFGYGSASGYTKQNVTNLVSSSGVIASDVTGVGTAREMLGASSYGGDKGIFGYGHSSYSMTNLVNNSGVVSADVTGVGTGRYGVAAASYGTDKAIFGYGSTGGNLSMTNLVNNSGVVAADVSGVGTARYRLSATSYGTDKVIFAYGRVSSSNVSVSNLVNNSGVVAADVTGVGTARYSLAAAGYGSTGQAIVGYGKTSSAVSMTNLVSNLGVVATDVSGVGTARWNLAATSYGGDKAIFGYGEVLGTVWLSMSNLVNNLGVVAADVTGVGTARYGLAAANFSYSA